MPSTNNKVKFGLKNCHYAKATLDPDTNAVTFGTPVAIPGAVNLSLDPEGDTEPFYADDMVYYTTVANNGYSGDLEIMATPLPRSLVKVKTGANTTDEGYNGWYQSVYQSPTTEPTEQGQG